MFTIVAAVYLSLSAANYYSTATPSSGAGCLAFTSRCKHLNLDGVRASAWRCFPLDPGHPLLDALDAGLSMMRLFRPSATTWS
jgi:hypothetical protein